MLVQMQKVRDKSLVHCECEKGRTCDAEQSRVNGMELQAQRPCTAASAVYQGTYSLKYG